MSETEDQQSGPDRPRGGSGPELARYGSPLNWPVSVSYTHLTLPTKA